MFADAAVYDSRIPLSSGESDVSPPREVRATDVTKLTVPMPFMLTIIAIAIGFAAGVWRVENKINVIETAMSYERQLDTERTTRATERDTDYRRYIDQRFATLEAKIETAALRNSALSLSQELQKQKAR